MASQQAFQAYPQNKGTLTPGQTISVNNHTVQVERYLSQGKWSFRRGFAHVYLVRTPTPVYNTTHHVLKRIQVSDESMLTEVRKEVDVMRLLKGHPNIVHLIDAAWHKMPNGMFEVFILMEYCPGGGIIDMMNRRLRERLTEAEILQIFVDVCEGVAYMHNSRPPLLHRDLKVENILQSSPTSFKLCDFGSATNVGHPPTNMQEIRTLEADLNRHTTLQYRAPEMVDVYSKRPINEKSDVWALGVLLYKLCYYTTPFEEHGPLAIINVQYRTPSYPSYSQDMNMLIASMLREHGAQRPTVFELLAHVHRLRRTKSKFSYTIPAPSPLSPRTQPEFKQSPSPNPSVAYTSPPANPALSFYGPHSRQNQPPINQGIQARDKILEAIAPMRRGRPSNSTESKSASSSRPASPQKTSAPKQTNADKSKNWLDIDFGAEQDRVWKATTEHTLASLNDSTDLGWTIDDGQKPQKEKLERSTGFGDNFTQKLWNSSDPNISGAAPPRLSPRPNLTTTALKPSTPSIRPLAYTGGVPRTNHSAPSTKDAFDGLGLVTTTSKPAPTMGEARKLRTGLAIVNSPIIPSDYKRQDTGKVNSSSRQPSLSPRPNYLSTTSSHAKSISPTPTPGTSNASSSPMLSSLPTSGSIASSRITNGLAIESRFPSLEELDARFVPSVHLLYPSSVVDASRNLSSQLTKNIESQPQRVNYIGNSGTGGNFLKPSISPSTSNSINGVRSEQVTGVAMREPKQSRMPESEHSSNKISPSDPEYSLLSPPRDGKFSSRPVLVKNHRTSMSMKPSLDSSKSVESTENTSYINLEPPQLPPRPSHTATPRDWLTGDDDHGDMKVPTGSTSSEVPVLRGSPSKRASYIELDLAASAAAQHVIVHDQPSQEPLSADLSPTVSKFKRAFPALQTIDTQDLKPSDLVENWSSTAIKDADQDFSSADEEPEDPRSLRSAAALKKTPRARGRQSSVHDLVYQYGGGVVQKEKEHERERVLQHGPGDYIPQQSKVRPSGLVIPTKPHMDHKTPSPTTKPLVSPIRRSPQPHRSSSQVSKSQLPLKANKSPTSGRSRPQSMFIFPSKSVDSPSIPSPGLVPPEGSRPRAVRRTSISDIVERYEAIGGTAKLAGPPSPLPKPVTTKAMSNPVESRRIQKPSMSSGSSNVLLSKASMSSDSSHSSMGDPSKSQSVSKEPPRQTVGLSRTPTKSRKSLALEKGELIHTQTVDNSTPRPRRISRKAEPFEPVAPKSAKAPFEAEIFTPTTSLRKPTLFGTDLSTSKSEDRSPSPERPYQGVGKLIDQWQKKSAEADSQPIFAGKRAGFVPKRVGIVHGDDGQGQ
ncbi:hypothetical protein BYT27DRAFT_7166536 [Phlegmacium glaucopus]|nr:hypothetical protein BYT27DRAFT_7166536 [Phlegmacium glaucopus]